MMDWPPQSLDLNPIELIWGELENKLDRSIVHSKESLWLELQNNISVEVLRKYSDTMPERCAAVIAAKGHTKRSIFSDLSGVLTILATTVIFIYLLQVNG